MHGNSWGWGAFPGKREQSYAEGAMRTWGSPGRLEVGKKTKPNNKSHHVKNHAGRIRSEGGHSSSNTWSRQPVQGGARYTPIYSLFTLLQPQAAKCCHPAFCRCIKAPVPQTQGRIKPLAKIHGVTVTRPFRLSNGIFHFEEGYGNMGEAKGLNRSLFFWKSFMVIAADRTLWSDAASGRTGNHLRAD